MQAKCTLTPVSLSVSDLFAAIIEQTHAALDRGLTKLADVQAAVDVDAIATGYPGAAKPDAGFHRWVGTLAKR